MTLPQNGDTAICEVCRQPITYFAGWRHNISELRYHAAWPGMAQAASEATPTMLERSWPLLFDGMVLLLTSGGEARLEAW